jgi:hypothetical protein
MFADTQRARMVAVRHPRRKRKRLDFGMMDALAFLFLCLPVPIYPSKEDTFEG